MVGRMTTLIEGFTALLTEHGAAAAPRAGRRRARRSPARCGR